MTAAPMARVRLENGGLPEATIPTTDDKAEVQSQHPYFSQTQAMALTVEPVEAGLQAAPHLQAPAHCSLLHSGGAAEVCVPGDPTVSSRTTDSSCANLVLALILAWERECRSPLQAHLL
ncbi:unnamed protein product [Rangifer tarandus platyrhynchus]|uniref:Uncharacterized protein n=2 Tax=Rangifer tarandus platyrhynchus TaxID=3082113 RepID=A0ACB0FEW2_RANTA|nr:unnamed protein product [Rangifer tarandus platyrhynchus]CAI9711234.1 unnamed protein product [Rangifer tarandus platyrhynchus]